MCIRVVERYAVCNCVYYVHGIDQCQLFGLSGHPIQERVVLVGHSCTSHLASAYPSYYSSTQTNSYSPAPSTYSTTTSSTNYSYNPPSGGASAATAIPQSTAKGYDFHNYYYSSTQSR